MPPPDPTLPPPPDPWRGVPVEPPGQGLLNMWHMMTAQAPYGKPVGATAAPFIGSLDPTGILGAAPAVRSQVDARLAPPEPVPEGGGGGGSIGERTALSMPRSSQDVMQQLQDYGPLLKPSGGMGKVDRTRTNLGYELAQSASLEGGKALEDEAYWNAAEKQDLGGVASKREKLLEANAGAAEVRRAAVSEKVAKHQAKLDADAEYVRTHSRIDPYRTFTTNAAAGIFALLGTALMAGGSAMKKDSSLDWTKQVDALLEREAQSQIRMLDNKKWAVTEAGQNVKRILDTSRDEEEAVSRIQAQHLAGLAERAAAISANAQSEAMKARGRKAVADLRVKVGEHGMNLGIREQALESQENQADRAARSAERGQTLNFAGGIAGGVTATENAKRRAEFEASAPVRTRDRELENHYMDARTAAQNFYEILRDPKTTSEQRNDAASSFASAYATFAGGGTGTAGVRNDVRTYGVTVSPEKLLAKINRQYNAKDMADSLLRIDQMHADKRAYLYSGKWLSQPPPTNSRYSAGP